MKIILLMNCYRYSYKVHPELKLAESSQLNNVPGTRKNWVDLLGTNLQTKREQ